MCECQEKTSDITSEDFQEYSVVWSGVTRVNGLAIFGETLGSMTGVLRGGFRTFKYMLDLCERNFFAVGLEYDFRKYTSFSYAFHENACDCCKGNYRILNCISQNAFSKVWFTFKGHIFSSKIHFSLKKIFKIMK